MIITDLKFVPHKATSFTKCVLSGTVVYPSGSKSMVAVGSVSKRPRRVNGNKWEWVYLWQRHDVPGARWGDGMDKMGEAETPEEAKAMLVLAVRLA